MKYRYKRPTFDFYDTVAMEGWGNQVVYIRYQGYADLSERLDLLANVLSNR